MVLLYRLLQTFYRKKAVHPPSVSEAIPDQAPWRKIAVQPEWITAEIADAMAKRADSCLESLQSDRLLLHMNARWIAVLAIRARNGQAARSPAGSTVWSVGGFGGYGSYGGENIELGFEYSHISWEQLEVIMVRHFDAHPGIVATRLRLRDAGIRTKWGGEGEHDMRAFGLYVVIDEESLRAIRKLAKQDAGIATAAEGEAFDRAFDLYLTGRR